MSAVEMTKAKPSAFDRLPFWIEGEDDLNCGVICAETCNLEQGSDLRGSDCTQEASPRQNHCKVIGDACEFSRKDIERFADAQQVRSSAARRLARGLPCSVSEALGIYVRCNEEMAMIAQCPTVGTTSVAAAKVQVNSTSVWCDFGSDLSTAAN